MFDIKTPKRTYYLAAETEADMRDWVNCICQVCHLHDTKQSNELPLGAVGLDENRTQHTSSSGGLSNSTQNTTTTSLHSSAGTTQATQSVASSGAGGGSTTQLRRPAVIEQQPLPAGNNNSDSVYVNTEYSNRESMLCDGNFDQQDLLSAAQQQPPPSPATALYLNHSALIQAQAAAAAAEQQQQQQQQARLAVSANGVVRKLPEHLVLNQQTLAEAAAQQCSVQASPALSTASGPYIPISECFSGSPRYLPGTGLPGGVGPGAGAGAGEVAIPNNPTTPLNNLDPKFYDTPRSHNNIGLNLTNDQSYSPKITNLSLQQLANANASKQRSDSDSESVFTDDDEWAHPLPLRENVDRSTRPSDSSIENESFVLTYSQRFSKMPEEGGGGAAQAQSVEKLNSKQPAGAAASSVPSGDHRTLEKLAKVLKNKNNLILDFKENEKIPRDLPQLSDTENTSPAIVARRNAHSAFIEESYDIPRSHQLPYYNVNQLLGERPVVVTSPHNSNPIAASTPNLMAATSAALTASAAATNPGQIPVASPTTSAARTLPRPHCYTNAAPTKMEGNVFRYDFMEQADCPPVNRKLKPKVVAGTPALEDKPPEEFPAKPPVGVEHLTSKLGAAHLQQQQQQGVVGPPSVDRKCKPNAYKLGTSATMSPATRRSSGAPLSMVLPHETDVHSPAAAAYFHETRTLPRQQHRQQHHHHHPNSPGSMSVQHQRTVSAVAAMSSSGGASAKQQQPPAEHKLQYLELDVTNKPPLNSSSLNVGNLYTQGGNAASGAMRMSVVDATGARGPKPSSVVYNSVDFLKTEAFKRIREERNKESTESGK
ncbi:protein daughter of sevenless isoform X2 [Drosophila kikkawai]